MMTALSAIFWGILTFSILVVLHEGGHFLVARAFGVRVHEFMIGLPGPALRFRGKKTTYGITAIPLGGYVRIAGMEPGPEDPMLAQALAFVTREGSVGIPQLARECDIDEDRAGSILATLADWGAIEPEADTDDVFVSRYPHDDSVDPITLLTRARRETFRGLPTWKRICVLAAGVVMNLAAAILVFVLVLSLYGEVKPTLTVDSVVSGSPAASADIRAGDTLTGLNGQTLADWQALIDALRARVPGDSVAVTLLRSGESRTIDLTLTASASGNAMMGVAPQQINVPSPVGAAFRQSISWVGQVFVAIAGFFNPKSFQSSVSQSTSIIGISVIVSQEAQRGPIDYAFIVALLSLSLGAMNILPIPPLDGGKIVMEVAERIARKPLSRNVVLGISATGTALLFVFIGYLMYADILRFIVNGG
ncbi:MAG: site-2 protease family protein [Coriobacteriia bacterium]|nr:site-2 protease family protein [Coriobacteriia bacterium]